MFTICICEGASKETPDLRIPPRRDRAPGLLSPGSATAEVCFDAPFVFCCDDREQSTYSKHCLMATVKVYACCTVKYYKYKPFENLKRVGA